MPLLDLSDVVNDPDLSQPYVVTRSSGIFSLGAFTVTSAVDLPFFGCIQPATDEEIEQVAQGDRITGAMSFISCQRMYETATSGMTGFGGSPGFGLGPYGVGANGAMLSDIIAWRGQRYGIAKSSLWGDWGFWKAVGIRLSGA